MRACRRLEIRQVVESSLWVVTHIRYLVGRFLTFLDSIAGEMEDKRQDCAKIGCMDTLSLSQVCDGHNDHAFLTRTHMNTLT